MPEPSPSHLTPEAIAAAVEAVLTRMAPRLAQRVAMELSVRTRPIHREDAASRILGAVICGKYRGISKTQLLRRFRTIRATEMDPILDALSPGVVYHGRRYYGAAYVPPVLSGEVFQASAQPSGDVAADAESTP